MELGINNSNYAIQNNNMKKNNSPSFKRLIIAEDGKKFLTGMKTITKETLADPFNYATFRDIVDDAMKALTRLKEIKPFAEKSEFYDLVYNGDHHVGIKSKVEGSNTYYRLDKLAESESEENAKWIAEIGKQDIPKYEKMIKIFQGLEERAQAKFEEMKNLASYFLNDMK